MLANRLLWIGIALGVLAFTHVRFRFAHPTTGMRWSAGSRLCAVPPLRDRGRRSDRRSSWHPRSASPPTRGRRPPSADVVRDDREECGGSRSSGARPMLVGPVCRQHVALGEFRCSPEPRTS